MDRDKRERSGEGGPMLQLDCGAVLLEPMATIASRRPTAVNGYPRPKVVANKHVLALDCVTSL